MHPIIFPTEFNKEMVVSMNSHPFLQDPLFLVMMGVAGVGLVIAVILFGIDTQTYPLQAAEQRKSMQRQHRLSEKTYLFEQNKHVGSYTAAIPPRKSEAGAGLINRAPRRRGAMERSREGSDLFPQPSVESPVHTPRFDSRDAMSARPSFGKVMRNSKSGNSSPGGKPYERMSPRNRKLSMKPKKQEDEILPTSPIQIFDLSPRIQSDSETANAAAFPVPVIFDADARL